MTLYEIKDEYLNALNSLEVNEDGEIVNFDAVEKLEADFEAKCDAVVKYILDQEALAVEISERVKAMNERKKAIENRCESLRVYIASCMAMANKKKFETPDFKLSFRKSTKVVITDEDAIPAQYTETVTTRKIDKMAIKKALAAEIPIDGAALVEMANLQIK